MAELTKQDIEILDRYADRKDREGYWTYLDAKGDPYAHLALQVVRNNTFDGVIANRYAKLVAEEDGVVKTPAAWDKVGQDLMRADLAARRDFVQKGNGILALLLPVEKIKQTHQDSFAANDLSLDAWTAWAPLSEAFKASDMAAAQEIWNYMVGEGFKSYIADHAMAAGYGFANSPEWARRVTMVGYEWFQTGSDPVSDPNHVNGYFYNANNAKWFTIAKGIAGIGLVEATASMSKMLDAERAFRVTVSGRGILDANDALAQRSADVLSVLSVPGSAASLPAQSGTAAWMPSTLPLTYADSRTVIIKQGDTLSRIAADQRNLGNNISWEDIAKVNGLRAGEELRLGIGQQVIVPQKVNGNLVVDYGNVRLTMNPNDGTYQYLINDPSTNTTTRITRSLDSLQPSGYLDRYVQTDNASGATIESFANAVGAGYGYEFNNGQSTNNRFALEVNPNFGTLQSTPVDATAGVNHDNSTLFNNGIYRIGGVGNVNTDGGNYALANNLLTDQLRPGAGNLATDMLGSQLGKNFRGNPDLAQSPVWSAEVKAAAMGVLADGVLKTVPTDPLVLDLNGDGVRLTSFGEAPVLFDIDHDNGSRELTGWVSREDGIVVMDLNGNGRIDGIHETLSEYFNGVAGSGTNAGEKKYANGFAALKSLDSNNDYQLTSADPAWNSVKVWVDADHDGVTDTGELRTLAQLGITRIGMAATLQSGLVNGGNEVLATGTFVLNGVTREVQAARFIADASGSTVAKSATGTTVTAENGQSSYVSAVATGETIDVARKGVRNAYGNAGADVLLGDAGANWLVGGQGADSFDARDGDDVLVIDADDAPSNIHAGAGFDLVQVVGSRGVSLDLAQAEAEIAIGGAGGDVLVGGGRSSVFIRAGDGDDTLIGGAANDALSGEDGADLVEGGAGNDVLRGGCGQDQLLGGLGDDLLEGGLDDDQLSGGTGSDVLAGGQGDDAIDGGDGIDVAQFSGVLADYRIVRLDDDTWRVADTRAGRDGADLLTHVEKLSFANLYGVDITLDNPMPTDDVITLDDRSGIKLIKVSELLANDRDWQGDALRLTTISGLRGGTVVGSCDAATGEWTPSLTANGEIQFVPDARYTGVMSFRYKVADADGTPGAMAFQIGTTTAAETRGQVFLKTPDMPSDPLFTGQWYLDDIDVLPVWRDSHGQGYTGKGVRIAMFETGMPYSVGPETFDYRHPDLQANADRAWLADPAASLPQTFSEHATLVAGVMAAARNGEGVVGVAYGAQLSGHYIQGGGLDAGDVRQQVTQALAQFRHYDVVNNSWGSSLNFDLNVTPVGTLEQGILDAVRTGRGGRGTVIVMAGGNDRARGGNTNYNALTANRAVITAGAINASIDVSTLRFGGAPFSNPGASILVSAPGSNIVSTSRILASDSGTVFGAENATTEGTSFAAPLISGVVALMLEANPDLGWRDIQQILAITAKKVDDPNTDTVWNGAKNWNGGAMHASHDYGFGEIDARAAVRLAESWIGIHTSANERHLAGREGTLGDAGSLNIAINDGATITRRLSLGAGVRVEHATVSLDLSHTHWGDLSVRLVSPCGTVSTLIANPGSSSATPGGDVGTGRLTFALDTTHSNGENGQGDWQLLITDRSGRGAGTLHGWKVDIYGSDWSETIDGRDTVAGETPQISAAANDTYFFTNEFATAPGTGRSTIADGNGGLDIVNAAAVSTGSVINLNNGTTSTIAGRNLSLNGTVEFAIGGDGNDTLIGNAETNNLQGGRGGDKLYGGDGVDLLDGGIGFDTLSGGNSFDLFVIRKEAGSVDTITDFNPGQAIEKILLVGFDDVADFSSLTLTQSGLNTWVGFGDGQSIVLQNVAPSQISEQNFGFFSDVDSLATYVSYISYSYIHAGTSGVDYGYLSSDQGDMRYFSLSGDDVLGARTTNDLIDGGDGNDALWGDYPGLTAVPGADWLEGGAGNDEIRGGDGADSLYGGSGNDILEGEAGNDVLQGATGSDQLLGGDGDDYLCSGAGRDYVDGGAGNDVLFLEADYGAVNGSIYNYYGTRVGGLGRDTFVVRAGAGGSGAFSVVSTNMISAYNLIADFNINEPGELIDLSNLSWLRGFSELWIASRSLNGTPIATVTAGDGANQIGIVLWGVAAVSLTAAHFRFAPNPGLVNGSVDDDTLSGDAGGNTLYGGVGLDSMTGRTGDDTYVVDDPADVVVELPNGGFDTVFSCFSYTLPANVENLVLTFMDAPFNVNLAPRGIGNDLNNRITGNDAGNMLDGGVGMDALVGGGGGDTYCVDNQADTVVEHEGGGIDLVQASVSYTLADHVEHLTLMGDADINATGNSLVNVLRGNAGSNILDGAAGADSMAGGAGDDTYFVDNIGDVAVENAEEGVDAVFTSISLALGANLENLVLMNGALNGTGNALDNSLRGNQAANVLSGGAGHDELDGGAGADTLWGGAGDDSYVVDNAADVIVENADEGTDSVYSSVDHALAANVENLVLAHGAAVNGTGNALNNLITAGAGANILDGGAGTDTLSYATAAAGVTVSLARLDAQATGGSGSDTVLNFENLTGSAYADALTGSAGANVLRGGAGADTLTGSNGSDTYYVDNVGDLVQETNAAAAGGTDTVYAVISFKLGANVENLVLDSSASINGTGNTANNVITAGAGANTLDGGAGIDTLSYAKAAAGVTVSLATQAAQATGGSGSDTVLNFENLTGSAYADVLTGNATANRLKGGSGKDSLYGGAGDDVLDGGAHDDYLSGGAGNDSYSFGKGSARDFISNLGQTDGELDAVTVGAGITEEQLWFQRVGNDLQVSLLGAQDRLTIGNWYGGSANHVDSFTLSSGKVLLDTAVANLVSAMASFAPPPAGQTTLPPAYQTALSPVIATAWN